MKDNEYFTTAEFAALANVSKQTLIYYDKSNIFSPAYKDENNFRYYSLDQFEALDTLISLSKIGVPLKEIREYLSNKSIEGLSDLLNKKNKMIKEEIKKLTLISNKIENKSLRIHKAKMEQHLSEPYFKNCNNTYILTSTVDSNDYKKIILKIAEFIKYCKKNNDLDNGNSIGGIIKKEDVIKGTFNKIKDIYIMVDRDVKANNITIKPEGIYAFINHKGGYDTTYTSYNKLISFIESNGYEIIGDAYENELIGYLASNSQDDYIIELSIKVQKNSL